MTELPSQGDQQFHLRIGVWGEVRVPSLRGDRVVMSPVPVEERLAETGAGCDDGDVPLTLETGLEHTQVCRIEVEHPVGRRLKIVQELDPRDLEGLLQGQLVQLPGKVRRLALALYHRSGHPEAGGAECRPGPAAPEPGEDR